MSWSCPPGTCPGTCSGRAAPMPGSRRSCRAATTRRPLPSTRATAAVPTVAMSRSPPAATTVTSRLHPAATVEHLLAASLPLVASTSSPLPYRRHCPTEILPALKRTVPGAAGRQHPVLAGAGHFLQEDAGEELGAIISAFVRET